jgi:uncharacterized coiled-coil protein SlyX
MSRETFGFSMPVGSLAPKHAAQATTTPQKCPRPSESSPEDNRTTGNMVSLPEANCQLITQMAYHLQCMEATLIAGQAASQNCIAQLEKQVATTTTELQKLHHLLSASAATTSHTPNSKGPQQPGPSVPPHGQKPPAPTSDPSPPDWPWTQMPENLSWADRVRHGSGRLTVNKMSTTVEQKKKKKVPETIVPKPHPRAEREVIITLNTAVTDAAATIDQTLQAMNTTIKDTPDITQPPLILSGITSNNCLVLTTNPTTKASAYELYLQMIPNAASNLNPVETRINEYWSKFLWHNVPTNTNLNIVHSEIEATYPSLSLGQTPRWLVPTKR